MSKIYDELKRAEDLRRPGTVVSASSVSIQGLNRGYLVIAPSDPSPGLPVIVVLGGVSASPTQEAARDELIPVVQSGKAILVYPGAYRAPTTRAEGGVRPEAEARSPDNSRRSRRRSRRSDHP